METTRTTVQATGSTLRDTICELLRQSGGQTVKDIAAATGSNVDGVRTAMNKLEKAGAVKRDGTAERVPGQLGKPQTIWRLDGGNAGNFSEASRTALEKLVGDVEGAKERRAAGRKQQKVEAERDQAATDGLTEIFAEVTERARDHGVMGEQQLLMRIRALSAAKRAEDWPAIRHALIDLAAAAGAWASRIDAAEGEHPAGVPVPIEPVSHDQAKPLNGSTKTVAERYADVLLDAATDDLDGAEARATIERLLGVGL